MIKILVLVTHGTAHTDTLGIGINSKMHATLANEWVIKLEARRLNLSAALGSIFGRQFNLVSSNWPWLASHPCQTDAAY